MGLFGDKTITCPYCMDVIRRKELYYKCKKCGMEYPSDVKVKSCSAKEEGKGSCSGMLELRCPTCNNELPATIFQFDKYIKFCIIGESGCGKTNYITVMIKEFEQKLNKKLLIRSMDEGTSEIQREHVNMLYNLKIPMEGTTRGYLKPQLWQITDRMKYNKRKEEYKVYSLTVFDGAGEDAEEMTEEIRRYINGSDYVFFLIDSLSLEGVRKKLGKQIESNYKSQNIVQRMADYIRMANGMTTQQKIDKKVAVILAKFDEVMGLMGNAQVTQENDAALNGEFLKNDADAIDSEIRSWLESIGEGYFLSSIESNFKHTRFFGVSSYGHAPADEGIGIITPHRVLDPIMWVLANEHIIN